MRLLIIAILFLSVIGCSLIPPKTAEEAYKKTTFTVDEYSKTKLVEGPSVFMSISLGGAVTIFMRKVNDSYQLHVTAHLDSWCFFNSAVDKNVGSLAYTKIRDLPRKGYSFHEEEFFLTISESQIVRMAEVGLDAKIYGRDCEAIVSLPPVYIQGFVKRASEL